MKAVRVRVKTPFGEVVVEGETPQDILDVLRTFPENFLEKVGEVVSSRLVSSGVVLKGVVELTKGPLKDASLDKAKYDVMLQTYYQKRGWDERGIPTEKALNNLGLADVVKQLKTRVKLSE